MADFYTNLPKKENSDLEKTISLLKDKTYTEPFQFNSNDYDVTVGFFIKKGFDRQPAEETAYVILQQSKIDNVPVQEILDTLNKSTDLQLSELLTVILNANRYKTSRLGTRNNKTIRNVVSRNIIV